MASIKINGDTSGSTTISAPDSGSDETIELSTVLDAKAPLASPTFTGTPALPDGTTLAGSLLTSGKILQIVRATDGTQRSTSSTSFVDVTGMSVTITPQKSDSTILVLVAVMSQTIANDRASIQITDSSNNALSGAEDNQVGGWSWSISAGYSFDTMIGYSTPATTSAVTYKLRFKTYSGTFRIQNNINTGQLYAIEVSA